MIFFLFFSYFGKCEYNIFKDNEYKMRWWGMGIETPQPFLRESVKICVEWGIRFPGVFFHRFQLKWNPLCMAAITPATDFSGFILGLTQYHRNEMKLLLFLLHLQIIPPPHSALDIFFFLSIFSFFLSMK